MTVPSWMTQQTKLVTKVTSVAACAVKYPNICGHSQLLTYYSNSFLSSPYCRSYLQQLKTNQAHVFQQDDRASDCVSFLALALRVTSPAVLFIAFYLPFKCVRVIHRRHVLGQLFTVQW